MGGEGEREKFILYTSSLNIVQLAEYFGWSVAAADLNNDGYVSGAGSLFDDLYPFTSMFYNIICMQV